jgi:hypothetical protein
VLLVTLDGQQLEIDAETPELAAKKPYGQVRARSWLSGRTIRRLPLRALPDPFGWSQLWSIRH